MGTTLVFGDNQVGTEYPNGIQVSDDQMIKPIGDRLLTQFGKFMGSTVSPDGRFLAATEWDADIRAYPDAAEADRLALKDDGTITWQRRA